jgi:hypothetical protein
MTAPYRELAAALTVRETAAAFQVDVSVNTDGAGVQAALVWIPKSQLRFTPTGGIEVADWLIEKLEERIAAEHPQWVCVGLRIAEDPNQMYLLPPTDGANRGRHD